MQIDSTPMDVMVLLDDGVPGRIELTAMIDVATRTLTAAVLRPTTKAVDASVLLARTVTPEPQRPGWAEALRMSRSVLPHRRLLSLDECLEHAAARPVFVPEMTVCDHGKAFISRNFKSSCRFLEIDFQAAHKGSGFEKRHIEKMLASIASLFVQFLPGHLGRSTDHRGRDPERDRLWSLPELQELLDEWIVLDFTDRRSSDAGSELRRFIDYMSVTVPHALLVSPDGVVLTCPLRATHISLSTNNKIDYVLVP